MSIRGSNCTCDDHPTGRDPFAAPPIDPECPVHGVVARARVLARLGRKLQGGRVVDIDQEQP